MMGETNLKVCVLMSIFLLGMVCPAAAGKIIVDADAPGANNGSSWVDAYKYLQDALADANSGDEIHVAEGIYTPDSNSAEPSGSGDRTATFQLVNGVTINGGYAGFGELDPNVRDIEAYETILSGDLNGDDIDVDDPYDLLNEPTRFENSYHVVNGSNTDVNAVLDGLTITGGNINSWGPWQYRDDYGGGMYDEFGRLTISNCTFSGNSARSGGGMYNFRSSPTLTSCTFSHNYAFEDGGGMYNHFSSPSIISCKFRENVASSGGGLYNNSSSPTITNCTFSKNEAGGGGGGGGGMYNLYNSSPKLSECTFVKNVSKAEGGGISDTSYGQPHGAATLTNCRFIGNIAVKGGGMFMGRGRPTLTNCMFIGNSADFGGAAAHCDLAIATYSKCTFAANSAQYGKAIYCSSWWYTRIPNIVRLNNCIVWDGGEEIYNDNDNNSIITPEPPFPGAPTGQEESSNESNSIITSIYSDVQGGWLGKGNIDVDPCFADANNVDYHLKSQAGRWDANEGRWTKDEVTSPCIDAGNTNSPVGLEPFPNGGVINMGAYGCTVEASKSYFGQPVCETLVAGDINGDCIVNFKDLAFMAFHWLEDRGAANSKTIIEDGIEYYVKTDKSIYELGEHTEILYRITNLTDEQWRISGMGYVRDILVEVKEGQSFRPIWSVGSEIPSLPGPGGLRLQPGESTEWRAPWPQFHMNSTGDCRDYHQAPPGTYRITGVVDGYRMSPEPPMEIHIRVSVDITVVY